jgi:hypothetical protein
MEHCSCVGALCFAFNAALWAAKNCLIHAKITANSFNINQQ